MSAADKKKRRKALENFYTDTKRQHAFFKFLESPKTTCPARNFLFWLDVEAYRLQRRLAKNAGPETAQFNDYEVCRAIFDKYVVAGAPYPIFMPNYTKLDITEAMEAFKNEDSKTLSSIGEHIFDEAQNAVEVSLHQALVQFERELQDESRGIKPVLSTDGEGRYIFIAGSFHDLLKWYLLDCPDAKFVDEFCRFLCIFRAFETPQGLFERLEQVNRSPDVLTTNSFDKDLILSRSRRALVLWLQTSFYCDVEGNQHLISKIREFVEFLESEYDDRKTMPIFKHYLESPMEFPKPQSARQRDVDLGRWTPTEIAEQLTLLDAFQYYAAAPDEMFAAGESEGAPHLTTLAYRLELMGLWTASSILKAQKPSKALVIFVQVLRQLFRLNNYNGIQAVLSGIFHPAVARLKKVFKALDREDRDFLQEVRQLLATRELYLTHLDSLSLVPCIPYIGAHVELMEKAYEANVDQIQSERGINYQPMRAVASVMWQFLRFQQHRYYEESGLKVNEELYNVLTYVNSMSEEELQQLTLKAQPLSRAEKRGEVPPDPLSSTKGGLSLTSLFKKKMPRKLMSSALDPNRLSTATTRTERTASLGEDDSDV